jgi:hypothetical protein
MKSAPAVALASRVLALTSSVVKLDALDRRAVGGLIAEIVPDQDAVAGRRADDQIVALPLHADSVAIDALIEHDTIDFHARTLGGIVDDVDAMTGAEHVSVAAPTANERVIADAAGQRVVAVVAHEHVVAGAAG